MGFSRKLKSTTSSSSRGQCRRHVREGDGGARFGSGAGEEGVLSGPLLLWHRHIQGSHLRPHSWQGVPLRRHQQQGRVQERGQTHVVLYEHVTEIYFSNLKK